MKDPNVTKYKAGMDQVCLLLKIANCLAMLSFMVPKAANFITNKVLLIINGMASHILSMPRPVGAGKYKYKPTIAGKNASVYNQVTFKKDSNVLRASAEMGNKLFMPK